jgi:hypothetical protein
LRSGFFIETSPETEVGKVAHFPDDYRSLGSVMPIRRRIIIFCAIATFAALTNLDGDIVRHSYAAGNKRAQIENASADETVTTENAVAEESDKQTSERAIASSKGFSLGGMKPLMRKTSAAISSETRKVARFIVSMQPRRLDFSKVSRRAPYLPTTGPVDVRFGSNADFDRSRNYGLAAYEKSIKDKSDAEAAAKVEQNRRLAELEASLRAVETSLSAHTPQNNEKLAASSGSSDAEAQKPEGKEVNSLQNKEINPEVLLRYFETDANPNRARGEISFVMPYQNSPQPLVMESKATYTETKKANEDIMPAK